MKQIQGQMSIFDRIEAPQKAAAPDQEQEKDPVREREAPKEFKDYIGRCEFCMWAQSEETCDWSDKNPKQYYKGELACKNKDRWKPADSRIPRLCANCEHSNPFVYQIKPENAPKNGKYSSKAADDPIEEPNIYCTKWMGSVNRSKPFQQFENPGFGVGHYHQQHEWDTCDVWEPDEQMRKREKENKGE